MRLLGIDVGSSSIKAVELEGSGSRYEIRDYHELALAPGQDPIVVTGRLVSSLPRKPDRIGIALPQLQSTFRNLTLPVRDRTAMISALEFELEDELPFELDKAHYVFSILGQEGKSTRIHVVATLKKYLADLVSKLQDVGIDPDFITSQSWAFYVLLNRVLGEQSKTGTTLLAHLGQNSTLLYLHSYDGPLMMREISTGGADITSAISARYGISFAEAEKAKCESGFVLTPDQENSATRDQVEFSNTVLRVLKEVFYELRQAALTSKNLSGLPLERILIAGGGAQLAGIERAIQEAAKVPVQKLRSLSRVSPSGTNYAEGSDTSFALGAGVALALAQSGDRRKAINLRTGDFSGTSGANTGEERSLKEPLAWIAGIAGALFLSTVVQNSVLDKRLEDLDSKIQKSMKPVFGTLSSNALRIKLSDSTRLKKEIQAEIDKSRAIQKQLEPNSRFPLDPLRLVSNTIPQSTVVDLIHFEAGAPAAGYAPELAQPARLTFLLKDKLAIDTLSQQLSRVIDQIEKSVPEEVSAPDGEGKRWKVTFSGVYREGAFGG